MFGIFIKLLRLSIPFVRECFFGKKPIPEVIYKNRMAGLFLILALIIAGLFFLMLDVAITLLEDRDKLKADLLVKEQQILHIEKELKALKEQLNPARIRSLEYMLSRCDAELLYCRRGIERIEDHYKLE